MPRPHVWDSTRANVVIGNYQRQFIRRYGGHGKLSMVLRAMLDSLHHTGRLASLLDLDENGMRRELIKLLNWSDGGDAEIETEIKDA